MDWFSELEAFLADKVLLKRRKVSIDDSTMADRALPRLNRDKLSKLDIGDISHAVVSKNLDKIKNQKTETEISASTLERYVNGFLKVLNAFVEFRAESSQQQTFTAQPMPPKIKDKVISAKGKKSVDGRLNSTYLSAEDFKTYCGIEVERYKKFRSSYPPKGAISNGEIKKGTIANHLSAIRNFLGFALKQLDLGYTKDDLCFAICLDTEVLERWEKDLALSKGEKNRQGTFVTASNNISALLSGNTGFIAQADKIFGLGPVFQKYLRINQQIMIREHGKDHPYEALPKPGLPFIKLIANITERSLIEKLEKSEEDKDKEILANLITEISIKHFKEACRLQYSPMKGAYKKSLKASQSKDKEMDGALVNVAMILKEPMPLKTIRDMVHQMYLSVDEQSPTNEQWNCARAMAIFCFMSAFPLRAKNISTLIHAKHNADFEHIFRTSTHWKIKIPASRLKNSYDNVEMDLPEDCNQYLDRWMRIRDRYKNKHIKGGSFFGFKPIFDDDEKRSSNNLGEFMKTWSRRFLQNVYSTIEFDGEQKRPVLICPNGINPHGMRHIVATNCKKNGVDLSLAAQLLLDDPDTVFKHYMHQKLGESLRSYYDTPAYKNSLSQRKAG